MLEDKKRNVQLYSFEPISTRLCDKKKRCSKRCSFNNNLLKELLESYDYDMEEERGTTKLTFEYILVRVIDAHTIILKTFDKGNCFVISHNSNLNRINKDHLVDNGTRAFIDHENYHFRPFTVDRKHKSPIPLWNERRTCTAEEKEIHNKHTNNNSKSGNKDLSDLILYSKKIQIHEILTPHKMNKGNTRHVEIIRPSSKNSPIRTTFILTPSTTSSKSNGRMKSQRNKNDCTSSSYQLRQQPTNCAISIGSNDNHFYSAKKLWRPSSSQYQIDLTGNLIKTMTNHTTTTKKISSPQISSILTEIHQNNSPNNRPKSKSLRRSHKESASYKQYRKVESLKENPKKLTKDHQEHLHSSQNKSPLFSASETSILTSESSQSSQSSFHSSSHNKMITTTNDQSDDLIVDTVNEGKKVEEYRYADPLELHIDESNYFSDDFNPAHIINLKTKHINFHRRVHDLTIEVEETIRREKLSKKMKNEMETDFSFSNRRPTLCSNCKYFLQTYRVRSPSAQKKNSLEQRNCFICEARRRKVLPYINPPIQINRLTKSDFSKNVDKKLNRPISSMTTRPLTSPNVQRNLTSIQISRTSPQRHQHRSTIQEKSKQIILPYRSLNDNKNASNKTEVKIKNNQINLKKYPESILKKENSSISMKSEHKSVNFSLKLPRSHRHEMKLIPAHKRRLYERQIFHIPIVSTTTMTPLYL
ncbi:hypothetical protein SNEBB_003157 [Seison nebaliae]|nr:hypothetical protein SNEBB_003157 [Seison nebaliae]